METVIFPFCRSSAARRSLTSGRWRPGAGVSVGKVNALLRQAEQEGYLLCRAGRGQKVQVYPDPEGAAALVRTPSSTAAASSSPSRRRAAPTPPSSWRGARRSEFDIPGLPPADRGGRGGSRSSTGMLLGAVGLRCKPVYHHRRLAGGRTSAPTSPGGGTSRLSTTSGYKWNGTMSGLALAEEALWAVQPRVLPGAQVRPRL